RPAAADIASLGAYIVRQLSQPDRIAFAIVDAASGRALGTSSCLNIRPAHRGLEIGHTWLASAAQGTRVNPEAKFLLLRHAFETLGCLRVELKTDARNEQSQRAMVKLGCTREGVLRKHMVLPDGFVRDTVMFSIVDTQWPQVRESLILRLGYTP
ncbi:MAG TPA: GNAT family protein, partial [Planctomycetota bacterium]|nr:GNAT family protein [Planctomycetota bacterium]